MSLNSGLSPRTVRAGLDKVFFQENQYQDRPGEVYGSDPLFFRQETADRGAVVTEEYQGPGSFDPHSEEQEVDEATIRSANQKTHTILNYKRGVRIPVEYYEDEYLGMVNETVRKFRFRADTSRDKHAFNNSYADAFSGVTSSDGVALISNSHTLLSGDTLDNLETGALTPANLETVVRSVRLQRDQDGELAAFRPDGLLVPTILHPDAVEIADSELKPGTGNNELNYFSRIYPGMKIGCSAWLDSTYNTLNTNANTSYFVVSMWHSVMRYVRKSLRTDLVDWKMDSRDRYHYKASFREVVSVISPLGVVGSNGTA